MNKERWVFLRGLTRGTIHWGDFPEIFKKMNPHVEMEFLELPGNGYLNNENSKTDVKELIDYLRSKSQFVKQKDPIHLCGISLGGMVALKWAELYPENIQSVTIINSSLKQFSPFYERLILKNYLKILRGLLFSNTLEQEKMILTITSNNLSFTQKYLNEFAEFARLHSVSKNNFVRQLVLASSIRIESSPHCPLKIISSQHDRLVHHSCSDLIAKSFGGKQFIHPRAGHDLPLDEPEWLCGILKESF